MIHEKFEVDSIWLTKKMCGEEDDMDEPEDPNEIVIAAHANLAKDRATVKPYKVDRLQNVFKSGSGTKISKRQRLNNAIVRSHLNLIKHDEGSGDYKILRIDYMRMN